MSPVHEFASLHFRLKSLRRKHEAIEADIKAEKARAYPDDYILQRLKRAKLKIRDESNRLVAKIRRHRLTPA